ncbi:MAG TPA: MATE family efflux transporter [Bacteroidota bacterium]
MSTQRETAGSLRANFSWTIAGNLFFSACSWAVLSLIAKLGTPEMVGQYTLAIAIVVPVMTFAQLQLRAIQATDVRGTYLFQHYFGLRVAATCLAMLIILGVALKGAYSATFSTFLLLVGLTESVESLSDIFYGLFQRQERMDRIAKSMAARGLLSLLGIILGLALTHNLAWGLFGITAGRLTTLLLYDIPRGTRTVEAADAVDPHGQPVSRKESVYPSLSPSILVRLSVLALPMGLVLMINAFTANLSRYVIAGFLGERELGIFAASASIVGISRTVVGALGQTASPRLARCFAEGRSRDYWRLLRRFLFISIIVGVAAVLVGVYAGRQILTLLFQAEYAEGSRLLVWLLAGAAVANIQMWGGVGLTAARQFRVQLPLSLLAALVNLGTNWWLVGKNGLVGAGQASLISAAVSTVAVFIVVRWALVFPGAETSRRVVAAVVSENTNNS